jgi:hypothetical protein
VVQFLVTGTQAVQDKLVGLEMWISFHHGLLEFTDNHTGWTLIIGCQTSVEVVDILLDLGKAREDVSIHRMDYNGNLNYNLFFTMCSVIF